MPRTPREVGSSASALGLLSRHRQARELLRRNHSEAALRGDAPPLARPQSAGCVDGLRDATVAAQAYLACSPAGAAAKAHFLAAPLGGGSPGLGQGRPQSAAAAGGQRAGRRPERPKSCSSLGRRVNFSDGPFQNGPSLLTTDVVRGSAPPLPPLPEVFEACQGPSYAAVSQQLLPALAGPEAELEEAREEQAWEEAEATAEASSLSAVPQEDSEADFTKEELGLEYEVEQALRELEAADAAMAALRQQLENAHDDVESTRAELAQLKRVAESWDKAAEEGRRELHDRRQRIEELAAVLPPEPPDQAAVWQGVVESQRQDLAAERLKVLEHQTSHLEEQVAAAQEVVRARIEERRGLEKQSEMLGAERDHQRAAQRDARARLRAMEARLKAREEAAASDAKHRQALERQLVRLRGEVNGLRARLASAMAAKAAAPSAAPAAQPASSAPAAGASPRARREARAVSLRLQKEVVNLWEALRRSDEEVQALGGSPQPRGRKKPGAPAAPAAAG